MKKATLLTFLFAVLMVALLVSCADPPEMLPDNTTESETTSERFGAPDETTENAEGSETSENGSGGTEETVYVDPEWVNNADPAPYTYIEDLPADKWYFDWIPPSRILDDMIEYRENRPYEDKDPQYAIKTPLRYEEERNGVIYRLDFFEEYHTERSLMQIRITIINTTEETIGFRDQIYNYTILVKSATNPVSDISERFWIYKVDGEVKDGYYGALSDSVYYEVLPGKTIIQDRIVPLRTELERYGEGGKIFLDLVAINEADGNTTSISIQIPFEVVLVEDGG
ncbi:MAG: hypothetical protein J6B77_02665, partial [Clostridia bacterium]|nr:hypothetical protein [Clostridia bacterium]